MMCYKRERQRVTKLVRLKRRFFGLKCKDSQSQISQMNDDGFLKRAYNQQQQQTKSLYFNETLAVIG